MWWPDKCLTNSCKVSKYKVQKQHLYRPPDSGELIMLRCTEHKCLSKWAFCLNIATHNRQANGFSPVCTLKWVFKFQDMPNCLPQYSHLYSRTGFPEFDPDDPPLFRECCIWCSAFSCCCCRADCVSPSKSLCPPGKAAANKAAAAACGGWGHGYINDDGGGAWDDCDVDITLSTLCGRLRSLKLLLLLLLWLFGINKSVGTPLCDGGGDVACCLSIKSNSVCKKWKLLLFWPTRESLRHLTW